MTEQPSHRRGFIKGIVAGIAGAFFALRGAEPVQAAAVRTPRKLRYRIMSAGERAEATLAVIAEVRPRRGTIEACWIYVGYYDIWALIEVGQTPDREKFVNWNLHLEYSWWWNEGNPYSPE